MCVRGRGGSHRLSARVGTATAGADQHGNGRAPEEIESAIDQRDAYIAHLLRRLRQKSPVQTPPDWVSLEHAPEELCEKLKALHKQLEDQLRHAEIEMSMERAASGANRINCSSIRKPLRNRCAGWD